MTEMHKLRALSADGHARLEAAKAEGALAQLQFLGLDKQFLSSRTGKAWMAWRAAAITRNAPHALVRRAEDRFVRLWGAQRLMRTDPMADERQHFEARFGGMYGVSARPHPKQAMPQYDHHILLNSFIELQVKSWVGYARHPDPARTASQRWEQMEAFYERDAAAQFSRPWSIASPIVIARVRAILAGSEG